MEIRRSESVSVRAVLEGDVRRLEILAAPFGGPQRRDRLNQWLSARTDFMIGVGDRRPLLYHHGMTPNKVREARPTAIGTSVVTKVDDRGLWMEAELDDSELANRTWDAAKRGDARASSGSVNYLIRPSDQRPGEVTVWPIAELSVFDGGGGRVPVSDDAIVVPLRAYFEELNLEFPDEFQAGEATNPDETEDELEPTRAVIDEQEFDMSEIDEAVATALKARDDAAEARKAERAEMRTEIEAELAVEPKYRATFATAKVTKEADGTAVPEDKQETHEYIYALRMAGLTKNPGAFRVLEESEALEGGPMVPNDLMNQIWEKRGVYSIVRRSGMATLTSSKLTFDIPAETSAIAIAPTIAEEAAYIANEPAFVTVPVSMLKKGLMVTATEEMLEDQDLFQSYLVGAAGKAIGLAENAVLFGALDDSDFYSQQGDSDALTVPELDALYFALAQEYREGAIWIANDATWGHVRGLLVSTPRAYGSYPDLIPGEIETFQGKRTFANANWTSALTSVNTDIVLSFVNLSESVAWVDRKGMSIFVDPYGDAENGRVRFFPSARFGAAVVNSDGIAGLSGLSV